MPDPDRLLRTIERAVQAFRETAGRRGRVVHLQNVADVLVAGDIHGHVANLRLLLDIAKLRQHPRRHLVLQELIHGSSMYPAGGDKSHQMLDLLAALKCEFPQQVHMLLGNHELAQWTGQRIAKGDREPLTLFREGLETAYGSRSPDIYQAYFELFAVVPVAIRTPNRVFLSHSLPTASRLPIFDPAVLEKEEQEEKDLRLGGSVHALVWGRDTSQATIEAFLKKVDADLLISGHIPCEEGFEAPNDRQLILDSMRTPAAYCLFPADRPLTHAELLTCVSIL